MLASCALSLHITIEDIRGVHTTRLLQGLIAAGLLPVRKTCVVPIRSARYNFNAFSTADHPYTSLHILLRSPVLLDPGCDIISTP